MLFASSIKLYIDYFGRLYISSFIDSMLCDRFPRDVERGKDFIEVEPAAVYIAVLGRAGKTLLSGRDFCPGFLSGDYNYTTPILAS